MPRANSIKANIIAMYIIQAATMLAPLMIYPHLIRVYGLASFGVFALGQTIALYLSQVVDFSSTITSTRLISKHRGNSNIVSSVFYSTILTKLVIFIMILMTVFLFEGLIQKKDLFLSFWMMSVAATASSPMFLYHGLERNTLPALSTLCARILSIILVYTIHENTTSMKIVIILFNSPLILNSLILILLSSRFVSPFIFNNLISHAVDRIKESVPIFTSNITLFITSNSTSFVVAAVSSEFALGAYFAAEKIIRAGQGLAGPLNQAFFARFSYIIETTRQDPVYRRFRNIAITMQTLVGLSISILIYLTAPYLALYVKIQDPLLVQSIKILSAVPFLAGLSNILSNIYLINRNRDITHLRISIILLVTSIAVSITLTSNFSTIGACASLVITEIIATTIYIGIALKNK